MTGEIAVTGMTGAEIGAPEAAAVADTISAREAHPVPMGPKSLSPLMICSSSLWADSDSKISSIKQYSDHRTKSKRRQ